jgi:hypothetical protein
MAAFCLQGNVPAWRYSNQLKTPLDGLSDCGNKTLLRKETQLVQCSKPAFKITIGERCIVVPSESLELTADRSDPFGFG